jgi:tetratricopeptide (TPR) repeat protein
MKNKGEKEAELPPGAGDFENGLKLWDAGRIDEAIVQFNVAGEKGFRTDAIENNLGAGFEKLGRLDEAIAHYIAALKANPGNFFALKNLGEIFSSRGEWSEARHYLAKALKADPDDGGTKLDYIRCLMAVGAFSKARKEVVSLFEMKVEPRLLIDALSVLREAEAFEVIVDLEPLIPPALLESSEYLKITGEAYLEVGMTEEAIGRLEKALSNGGDAVTKSWLGLAEVSMGNDARGMSLLDEALSEGGDNLQVLRTMSFVLHGKDKLEDVLPIYERAVALYPDEFVLWNNWGNALYNLHRYAESIPKFVMAIEKNQDYEVAWNNIGNALEKMKLFKESLPFHLRAIEINNEFDYAHYAAAVAMLMTGDSMDAIMELEKSLMFNPTFPEAWDLKARSLISQAPEAGLSFAVRAIETEPDTARPWVTLAMCQMMAGMSADAERNLREAARLAWQNNDQRSLKEIKSIEEEGEAAINRIIESEGLSAVPGLDTEGMESDAERAFNLYRLGSESMLKGKAGRSADLYGMAFQIDDDSSAIAYALLKSEKNKERLKKYLEESRRIHSSGFATPSLTKAMEEASHKLEPTALDRTLKKH